MKTCEVFQLRSDVRVGSSLGCGRRPSEAAASVTGPARGPLSRRPFAIASLTITSSPEREQLERVKGFNLKAKAGRAIGDAIKHDRGELGLLDDHLEPWKGTTGQFMTKVVKTCLVVLSSLGCGKEFKEFHLKDKARIWPRLSHVYRVTTRKPGSWPRGRP